MSHIESLIKSFSVSSLQTFFRQNISSFKADNDDFDYLFKDEIFDKYESITKIGEATIENDEVVFIASKTNDPLTERSGKKKQYEIAKTILKHENVDAALFVFYDANGNFRFSFVKTNYLGNKRDYTDFKRYSYFVSPKQTNKTFIKQVGNCTFNSLDEIIKSFSVEPLNKDFYQEIATAFYGLIGGKIKINTKEVTHQRILQLPSVDANDGKKFQEFAVRLIGRTIFCWFLKNKKSEAGKALIPEEWLSSEKVIQCGSDNYYHTILEKLFFLILNKKVDDRKPYSLPNGHEDVPFLNGGLFEAQEDDFFPKNSKGIHQFLANLVIPNEWFENLFKVLEQYNFTIDENSINDSEVSIDPEMLGTIFENLLAEIDPDTEKSARKSTGSFYTPREIVDYMVEQSLLNYLRNKTAIDDEELLQSLFKEGTENSFDDKTTKAILQALSDVKILDPACGSGAFPMGALHKIIVILKKLDKGAEWWKQKQLEKIDNAIVRKALKEKLDHSTSDYARKLGVIQHSIYGVDIQPIASEISKLRSFLSLIIDENIDDSAENRGVEPLPNLEFKFVTGNTLIGLDEGSAHKTLALDFGETETLQNQLQEIRADYLQTSGEDKEKLKKQFEKVQQEIFKNELKGGAVNKRAQQLVSWKPFTNNASEWFDPLWMFGVEKFDIVIGNPPYIDSETMVKSGKKEFRDYLVKRFNYCKGNWDIYIPFFEFSNTILSKYGVLTFITPDKWTSKPFGKTMRENLLHYLDIIVIAGRDIFETAKVDAIITFFNHSKSLEIKSYSFSKKDYCVTELNRFMSSSLDSNFVFDMFFSDKIDFIYKLNNNLKFSDLGICENACSTADTYKLKELICDSKVFNKEVYKVINTGTIDKFISKWGTKEMKYLGDKYLYPVVDKKRFEHTFKNSYYEKTNKSKLIIKGLTLLDACLDEEGIIVPGKSTLIITSGDLKKLKFLLGLINCDLFIFILKEKYASSSYNGGVNFTKDMINNLPLSKNYEIIYDKMISLIDQLLHELKIGNCIEDIKDEINYLVYKIYSLTYQEVILINPEFKLTQTEYDNYKID